MGVPKAAIAFGLACLAFVVVDVAWLIALTVSQERPMPTDEKDTIAWAMLAAIVGGLASVWWAFEPPDGRKIVAWVTVGCSIVTFFINFLAFSAYQPHIGDRPARSPSAPVSAPR